MKFVGIANYLEVLGSMELLKNLGNTLMFIIVLLILNFLLPYLYSYILGHLVKKYSNCYLDI